MTFGSKLAPVPADFSIGKVNDKNIYFSKTQFFFL